MHKPFLSFTILLRPGGFAERGQDEPLCLDFGENVVQVHGQGPFAISYVNHADDPSKK